MLYNIIDLWSHLNMSRIEIVFKNTDTVEVPTLYNILHNGLASVVSYISLSAYPDKIHY